MAHLTLLSIMIRVKRMEQSVFVGKSKNDQDCGVQGQRSTVVKIKHHSVTVKVQTWTHLVLC